jgi:hypothetical protein
VDETVIARSSATKQSILSLRGTMDCVVASLLAMTAIVAHTHTFAIPRRNSPG